MDTDRLPSFLINGGLINILNEGHGRNIKAWIVPDSSTAAGFRTAFVLPPSECVGGRDVPNHALEGQTIFGTSEAEVIDYLVDSFGLTRGQAERVAIEAHP